MKLVARRARALAILCVLVPACGSSRPAAQDTGPAVGHDTGPAVGNDTGPTLHDTGPGGSDGGHDAGTTPVMDGGNDVGMTTTDDAGNDVGMTTTDDAGIDTGTIVLVDAGHDAATLDAGNDASTTTTCNPAGHVGAHCTGAGACSSGSACATFTPMTVQTTFGIPQGTDDIAHTGYSIVEVPAVASEAAPFNFAEGTLCAQQCDTSVADTCGACTTCANVVTQMPLLAAFGGTQVVVASPAYGSATGLCRLDCAFNPSTRGAGCPDSTMSCDAFSGTCVEACTTDTECNTAYGVTYSGLLVTALVTDHPQHCNTGTGRCEATGTAAAHVGDACDSSDACLPGSGVCLNGGLCGELGCVPGATGVSVCGGGAGLCLATSESSMAVGLCLRGCNVATDCGPGNACNDLGVSVGGFAGYCIGSCGADADCASNETCTDSTDASGNIIGGTCQPRCTHVGLVGAASGGCTATQFCVADHAGATYGTCAALDVFCGAPNTANLPAASTECATGYRCDETLATPRDTSGTIVAETFGDGHCRAACTTGTCGTGTTCVTTGTLAGLCRHACSAGSTTCPADQTCNTTLGYCVEVATM